MIADIYQKPILVFGCGNVLFGDDGFGPAVIQWLKAEQDLPPAVTAVDVGTSVRDLLFDLLLAPVKPRCLLIVDATGQAGTAPGELVELELDRIEAAKSNDFSVHQFPSLNLLQELNDQDGVEVRVLAVRVSHIPDRVAPGLSGPVAAAVPAAGRWVIDRIAAAQAG